MTSAAAPFSGADSASSLIDEVEVLEEHPVFEEMIAELHKVKGRLRSAEASLVQCSRDAQEVAVLAQRAERSRLAQMLHDGLQQVLVAARMRLELSIRLLPEGDTKKAVVGTQELLTEAIKASRTLTLNLSPPHFLENGLGPALNWLSGWFATHHGLKVAVEVATGAEPKSEALRTLVFEGVREALFNTVKHAGIDNARVRMACAGMDVQVVVEDRGIGFEPASVEGKIDGFGLFSVKRRLELLGGAMDVISASGAGTRVTMRAPATQRGRDRGFDARS